jgi:hypothetical protein
MKKNRYKTGPLKVQIDKSGCVKKVRFMGFKNQSF